MSHDVEAFLDRQARRSTPRATLKWLAQNPNVRQWFDADHRKPMTRYLYANSMRKFFDRLQVSPQDFIASLQRTDVPNHRETKIAAKTCIAKYWRDKPATANMIISGLQALTKFHEIEPPFALEYYQAKRKNLKKRHTWEEGTLIIEKTPIPYRQAFEFMRWTGLDEQTFCLINSNAPQVRELNDGNLHASISKQMQNDKPYVRIDLPPRKRSIDTYFVLAPKIYVPPFPLLSIAYEGATVKRGNTLISSNRLSIVWRHAAKRVGLYHPGFGVHNLRSIFRTKCSDLGIPEVAEWMLGRGGDVYGYDRSGFDERFLVEGPTNPDGSRKGGLSVLWGAAPTVDRRTVRAELGERDAKIEELRKQLAEHDLLLKRTAEFFKPHLREELAKWSPGQLEQLAKEMRKQKK
jgi:hypothetical protein